MVGRSGSDPSIWGCFSWSWGWISGAGFCRRAPNLPLSEMARVEWVIWLRGFICLVLVFDPFSRVLSNMEGDALHYLKANLNDPNNVLQSWDPTLVNPCTWFHVTCNNDNSVIRVDLGNAQLSGTLVPQLGQLKNLQYLELYSNNISGMIPSDLGNLTNLVSLDLYLNSFAGEIPDSLGKLTKLRFLCKGQHYPAKSVGAYPQSERIASKAFEQAVFSYHPS